MTSWDYLDFLKDKELDSDTKIKRYLDFLSEYAAGKIPPNPNPAGHRFYQDMAKDPKRAERIMRTHFKVREGNLEDFIELTDEVFEMLKNKIPVEEIIRIQKQKKEH